MQQRLGTPGWVPVLSSVVNKLRESCKDWVKVDVASAPPTVGNIVRRISLDAAPPFASITSGESPTATAANRTRSASPAPQCALIWRLPPTAQPELLELAAKYLGPQLGLWIALGIEHKEADPTSVRVGR